MMTAGYSGTPLVKKLGYKPEMAVYLANAPKGYKVLIAPIPDGVRFRASPGKNLDIAHIFVCQRTDLR